MRREVTGRTRSSQDRPPGRKRCLGMYLLYLFRRIKKMNDIMIEISPSLKRAIRAASWIAAAVLLLQPVFAAAQVIPEPQTTIPQPTSSFPGPIDDPSVLTTDGAPYAYASFGFSPTTTKSLYLLAAALATMSALFLSGTIERLMFARFPKHAHASESKPAHRRR